MFLLEWLVFPSAPCLTGKETWWQIASRCRWNRARPWHASELLSFLVRLRNFQHPAYMGKSGRILHRKWTYDHQHTQLHSDVMLSDFCYVCRLIILLVMVFLVWWFVVVEFVAGESVRRSWVSLVRGSDSDVRDWFLFLKKLPSSLNPCLLNWKCGLLWTRAHQLWKCGLLWTHALQLWKCSLLWTRAHHLWKCGLAWTRAHQVWKCGLLWTHALQLWKCGLLWSRAHQLWKSSAIVSVSVLQCVRLSFCVGMNQRGSSSNDFPEICYWTLL
jgi:hypothetical protein